jgi:selenide,water dikinase
MDRQMQGLRQELRGDMQELRGDMDRQMQELRQELRADMQELGGVAMSVVKESEMIRPTGIMEGDILVLTKPLGNQLAVNLKQWLKRPSLLYKNCIEGHMTEGEIDALYASASSGMMRLNLNGAKLMHKYRSHGATDVTGFGILGHARNLGAAQDRSVFLNLTFLPFITGALKASRLIQDKYKLLQGLSAETSGGLLVALPSMDAANQYIKELKDLDGTESWVVGHARARTASDVEFAGLVDTIQLVDV